MRLCFGEKKEVPLWQLWIGVLFALLPLVHGIPRNMNDALPVFIVVTLVLVLSVAIFVCDFNRIVRVRLNEVDVWLGLYVLYAVLHEMVLAEHFAEPVSFVEWTGLIAVYVLCRNFSVNAICLLPRCMAFAGVVQAVLGLFQWSGLLSAGSNHFVVSGSFSNPGPYGGCLAIAALCAFSEWRRSRFSLRKRAVWAPVSLLFIFPALLLADSRAAWLAVLVFIYFSFVSKKSQKIKIAAAIVLLVVAVLLYGYRKDSADVRLLVWRAASGMIMDNPWVGYGSGSFFALYMPCQAEYLDNRGISSDALLADNNLMAFNDWLRLLCEQGVVGGVLFFLLIFCALRPSGNVALEFARWGLVAWCVFACFSYPASVFSLKMCVPLFLGCIASSRCSGWEIPLPCFARVSVLFALAAILGLSFCVGSLYRSSYRALYAGGYESGDIDTSTLKGWCQSLDKNYLYLLSERFVKENRLADALCVKLCLARIAPTSSLHGDIGMLFFELRRLDDAACHFQTARRMTPNHITPVYGLFLVACEKGNCVECLRLARELREMPVRVVNNRVLKARHEAKDYIEQCRLRSMEVDVINSKERERPPSRVPFHSVNLKKGGTNVERKC